MSLNNTFNIEGRFLLYASRNGENIVYLLIMQDVHGKLLFSVNNSYIKEQLHKNIFNIETVIREILQHLSLQETLLQQIEKDLKETSLPISIDTKSRSLFHITETDIYQFHIGLEQKNVFDLRYLGKLSERKLHIVYALRKIGVSILTENDFPALLY